MLIFLDVDFIPQEGDSEDAFFPTNIIKIPLQIFQKYNY